MKERPTIKQFFGDQATLEDVHRSYTNSPELFNYAQSLDRHIDDLQSRYDKLLEENINMEKNCHNIMWERDKLREAFEELLDKFE